MTRALSIHISNPVRAFVLASLLVLAFGVMPLTARAAALTEAQVSSVLLLLSSFGVDQGTVSSVEEVLRGSVEPLSYYAEPVQEPLVTYSVPEEQVAMSASVYFGPLEFLQAYSEAFDQNLAASIEAMVYMPESLYETMSRVPDVLATLGMVPGKAMAASLSEALYQTGLY